MEKTTELTLEKFSEISRNDNTYVFVCNSDEIKEGKGIRIAFEHDVDMQFAVFRVKNKLYCVSNICPHRHATKIFEGIIKGLTVTCPLHGWTYSLETGEDTNTHQGIKKLNKYEIFEENNMVFMEKPALKIPKWRQNVKIEAGKNPIFD